MTLSAMEFLRRFVQHILPRGFVRIRQSGFLANSCRTARVALTRALYDEPPHPTSARLCAGGGDARGKNEMCVARDR
jgi:hypothetical protein